MHKVYYHWIVGAVCYAVAGYSYFHGRLYVGELAIIGTIFICTGDLFNVLALCGEYIRVAVLKNEERHGP